MKRLPILLVSGLLGLWGCDALQPEPEDEQAQVVLQFEVASQSGTAAPAKAQVRSVDADQLVLEGRNGTLTITDIQMVVAEFELKQAGADCAERGRKGCGTFTVPPFLVDLPLSEGAVVIAADQIPYGTYSELEFEVKDLYVDRDDGLAEARQYQELIKQVQAVYPDWPNEASLAVAGRFEPRLGPVDPGVSLAFTAFADAEIEVDMELDPPFVLSPEADNPALTVQIDPALWFEDSEEDVLDLTRFDFGRTGTVLEFKLKLKEGFTKTRFERGDDADD